MPESVTLITDRLCLRPWCDADRQPFADINADREVREYYPSTMTRQESDASIDRIAAAFAERGWGLFAVEVIDESNRNTGQAADGQMAVSSRNRMRLSLRCPFIGYVGLATPNFEAHFMPCHEIGWRLSRESWGHGFATEAAIAVCRFAFEQLKLQQIVSFTATANVRSQNVMKRIGMSHNPSDDFDHPALPVGHWLRRHVLYRLANPNIGENTTG